MPVEAAKQATMVDVARRAGVSYQTVSRVINKHPSVAPKTRERVLAAVEELDYHPNVAARNLVTRRSRTVGIVSYGTSYFGPGQMLTNIEASLREREYGLMLSTLSELGSEHLRAAILELRRRSVDGIVMITPMYDVDVDAIPALCGNVPFVLIDVALGVPAPSVVIDQRHGGVLATRHLLERGHRRIAVICGPLTWSAATLRNEGTLGVLNDAGLAPVMTVEGDWSASSGFAGACELLDAGARFSALVVANDQMALGAMRALRERGLHVPEDVSVVGFDDLPEAAYFEPPLTTVHQDFVSLGRQSAEYLGDLLDEPTTPPMQRVITPELVTRSSTRSWR